MQLPGITKPVKCSDPIYPGSNFTWGEATMNGTRIPVDTNFRGTIVTAAQITANIIKIAKELDKIREQFGNKPITINSWYRDPKSNRAVGGAKWSQHVLGWGVDFTIEGYEPFVVAAILLKTWGGGLGRNIAYTHLDLRQLMGWVATMWNYGVA